MFSTTAITFPDSGSIDLRGSYRYGTVEGIRVLALSVLKAWCQCLPFLVGLMP